MRHKQHLLIGLAVISLWWGGGQANAQMAIGYTQGIEDPVQIVKSIAADIQEVTPNVLYVFATPDLNLEGIVKELSARYPAAPLWGCTSARGIHVPRQGFLDGKAVSVIAQQSDLEFSVQGFAMTGTDWLAQTDKIIAAEKDRQPSMILLASHPGAHEEAIMERLKEQFGRQVRIYGGTSGSYGQNATGDPWPRKLVFQHQTIGAGAVFCFIYGDKPIADTYLMGFTALNQKRGKITRAVGRIVYEINGKPALEEYNRLAEGFFTQALARREDVRVSGLQVQRPLAVVNRNADGKEFYISLSAEFNYQDQSILFFATVPEGSQVAVLDGGDDATQGLSLRFQEGAADLNRQLGGYRNLQGGLFFICMGSHNLYGKTYPLSAMTAPLNPLFRQMPWVGVVCNGEKGRIAGPGAESMHGNLMAAGIAFGK